MLYPLKKGVKDVPRTLIMVAGVRGIVVNWMLTYADDVGVVFLSDKDIEREGHCKGKQE
jgi:hypothetical protein